jgi:hypothetical protein
MAISGQFLVAAVRRLSITSLEGVPHIALPGADLLILDRR